LTESLPLNLATLGATYPNSQAADSNDWLDERDGQYVEDSQRLEQAGYLNAAYGRALTDGFGTIWLEYWFWYYYNDKSVAGFGKHEGDWESVLVGLDSQNKPNSIIFSQHQGGMNCYVGDVETNEEGGPVVYVASGSHANYPLAGNYDLEFVGEDYADGNGGTMTPPLEIIESQPPSWLGWPGHWGNSHSGNPAESDSPTGPAYHQAWERPDEYAGEASECLSGYNGGGELFAARGSTGPEIESATVKGDKARVRYDLPAGDGKGAWPKLRLSVEELDDGELPPRSILRSDPGSAGSLTLPYELDPEREAVVFGSVFYKDGRRVHLAPRPLR
jgi:hypothetical protein